MGVVVAKGTIAAADWPTDVEAIPEDICINLSINCSLNSGFN
jgi:hypothetical protein